MDDPVGTLRVAVDGLLGQDPAERLDGELGTDLLRWSRQRDREDAGFAAQVLAAVRRGVGVEDGYVDTVGWFAWKTGKARAEVGTLAVRQAEGFVRMCEVALGRGTDAEGSRPVVSYATHARTAGDTIEPLTLGIFAGVVDPRERDRILCDASIVPVSTNHLGEILDVGRATNVWNRAMRRALTTRSPNCQWPGCEIPAPWCDAHHFIHWEHGGPTSLANGVHLCRRHHTFVHRHRDWSYTFDRQQFRVYRPDSTEVHPDAFHEMNWAV